MVHRNRSDKHSNQSDTWPCILITTTRAVLANTPVPSLSLSLTYTLSLSLSLSLAGTRRQQQEIRKGTSWTSTFLTATTMEGGQQLISADSASLTLCTRRHPVDKTQLYYVQVSLTVYTNLALLRWATSVLHLFGDFSLRGYFDSGGTFCCPNSA